MDGARAAFFRTSRRFSCFFAFANFQVDIAWMTRVRTSFIFFRAGLGRSVKHSTSGGRDIAFGMVSDINWQARLHLRSSDASAQDPPIAAVVPCGAEKSRFPTGLAT